MLFPLRDDNPRRGFPAVTVGLIVVNFLVQLYQMTMSPERAVLFARAVGAIPLEVLSLTDVVRFPDQPPALVPIPLTLITSMFVHGGWVHLLSNMWYLWLFGDNIEDSMGHLRFVLFYLLAGLAAALAQMITHPTSLVPMVGASGAIAGVLGGYALIYPRARVNCLLFVFVIITFIKVPAIVVLGLWFAVQLVQGLGAGALAQVAWFAHIGGFIAGLVLVKIFVRSRPPDDEGWRRERFN